LSTFTVSGTSLDFATAFNSEGLMTEALTGDSDYEYEFEYVCE